MHSAERGQVENGVRFHRHRVNEMERTLLVRSLEFVESHKPLGFDLELVRSLRDRLNRLKSGGRHYRGVSGKDSTTN